MIREFGKMMRIHRMSVKLESAVGIKVVDFHAFMLNSKVVWNHVTKLSTMLNLETLEYT